MRKLWSSARWPLRLLILCVLIGLIFISSSREKARADVQYSCENQLSFCYYNAAVANEGDLTGYGESAGDCDINYLQCQACDRDGFPEGCMGGVDIPEPYPVVADYTMCMSNCASACNWLPLGERGACFVPCKVNCIDLYAH